MRSKASLEGGVLEGSLRSKSELKSVEESGTRFGRFERLVVVYLLNTRQVAIARALGYCTNIFPHIR